MTSPGISWQQKNCELRNLTVLQILKVEAGLSHSLGSTCCTSACFHLGLSLSPPEPGPLRPPQACSAGCRSKSPEEHQLPTHLNWRPNPPYPHFLPTLSTLPCVFPAMALLTLSTFYLVFVRLGHLVDPMFPGPLFTCGAWMCVLSVCCYAWRFLEEQRKEKKHQNPHFQWSHEHMNYAETMFHCYLGGHRVIQIKFCSSNWSPLFLFIWKVLSCWQATWMEIQCEIPRMLQRVLWVQSCECHKCYHKWFTDTYSKWSKTNFPTATCDSFVAIAMLGKRVLLESCISLVGSHIFWMKFSGILSFEKIKALFPLFFSHDFPYCLFLCTLETVWCTHFHLLIFKLSWFWDIFLLFWSVDTLLEIPIWLLT